jgi:hypothetical protein
MAIQISGCTVIDNSRDSINIRVSCAQDFKYVVSACTALGSPIGGYSSGNLICKASSVGWIVAPNASQVSRTWYCRDDANTTAQSVSGCTGWFVPTISQLQNPGFCCRVFWDSFSSSSFYWSSTECNATHACLVFFDSGSASCGSKNYTRCARAFRCVTY